MEKKTLKHLLGAGTAAVLLSIPGWVSGQMVYEEAYARSKRTLLTRAVPVTDQQDKPPVKVEFLGKDQPAMESLSAEAPENSLLVEKEEVKVARGEALAPEIRVFPNPTQGISTLEITVAEPMEVEIRLSDMQGRDLGQIVPPHEFSGTSRFRVDLTQSPAGMYFIHAVGGEVKVTERLIRIK